MRRVPVLSFLSSLLVLAACAASSGVPGAGGAGGSSSTGNGSGQGGDLITFDGGSTVDPDAACLTDTFGAEAAPAYLMFQLDVSGSMNCAPTDATCATGTPGPGTRWDIFKTKLTQALDALPAGDGAGLMHYPTGKGLFTGDPTGCVPQTPDVALGPLSTTKAQIAAKLASIAPAGGTPTHDAVTAALAQIQQANVPGAKYLVLATDGQATFCAGCDISCDSAALAVDNDALVAAVAAAAASGVRTFVLGAPGSNAYRGILSRLAEAGQTQAAPGCTHSGPTYCHYDMTTAPDFGAALQTALAAVGGATLSCVYDIPKPNGQFDPTQVNVQLTMGGSTQAIPQDKAHGDGWDYSADGKQILLFGPACDAAKAAMNGKIDILYGCPTVLK